MRVAYSALPVYLGIPTSGIGGSGLPMMFRFCGGYPCHFFVTIFSSPSTSTSSGPWPPPVE